MKPTFFATPAAFRAWLEKHHAGAAELWVGYWKKETGRPSLTWPESVDQALCFGWIDGIRKSLDARSYAIRFTPRKPRSRWSAINVGRVAVLTREGRMRPAGLAAYAARREEDTATYSYEREHAALRPEDRAVLEANPRAAAFFDSRPPGYRRLASWYVVSAKREETRRRRLAALIAHSARGELLPQYRPLPPKRGGGSKPAGRPQPAARAKTARRPARPRPRGPR